MKKKKIVIPYFLIISLLISAFSFSIVNLTEKVDAWGAPSIEIWGEKTVYTPPGNAECSMPGIGRASNGTLVMTFQVFEDDDAPMWVREQYIVSYDNGTTWHDKGIIASYTWNKWAEVGFRGPVTCENGDMVVCHYDQNDNDSDGASEPRFFRSTDNGETWSHWYDYDDSEVGDGDGDFYIYDWYTYENDVYCMCGDDDYVCGDSVADDVFIMYNTANCTAGNWTKLGVDVYDKTDGKECTEWSAIPLNSSGGWRLIHRSGDGCELSAWGNDKYSSNNGTTWSTTGDRMPINNDNRGPALRWLDDEVILANIEIDDGGTHSSVYESHDNMSSFNLVGILEYEGTAAAYSRFCALPKRDGDIGGWGCMATAKINSGGIQFMYIANNATQTWEWPPGPYDEAQEDLSKSEFVSINSNSNNSIIYDSTPTINWTVVANTSQYHLEIDNNADFSSPEINYTNINQWNYPSNCDINATRVSFTLPTGLSTYDKYYMRVRTYIKN